MGGIIATIVATASIAATAATSATNAKKQKRAAKESKEQANQAEGALRGQVDRLRKLQAGALTGSVSLGDAPGRRTLLGG